MAELRQVLAVAGIALGCALALAAANRFTAAPIERNETAAARNALAALVGEPADRLDALPDLSRQPAVWDYCGRLLIGRSDLPGYGGPIRLLYTLTPAATGGAAPSAHRLSRAHLLAHQETPGITDFLRTGEWLSSLAGMTSAELAAVDTVTGATITSRAITDGLAAAVHDPRTVLGTPLTLGCGA